MERKSHAICGLEWCVSEGQFINDLPTEDQFDEAF